MTRILIQNTAKSLLKMYWQESTVNIKMYKEKRRVM
jgi:hypothetical protein